MVGFGTAAIVGGRPETGEAGFVCLFVCLRFTSKVVAAELQRVA